MRMKMGDITPQESPGDNVSVWIWWSSLHNYLFIQFWKFGAWCEIRNLHMKSNFYAP